MIHHNNDMNGTPTTLVFSSGGIHGIHFVGCLRALEESAVIASVRSIRGSSVGAFFGTLVCLGYTAKELENTLMRVNTNALFQVHLDNILKCFDTYGIDNGDRIEQVFEIFLVQKTGQSNITFRELFQHTGIHLVVSATCVTTSCVAYFDYKRTPMMKVSQGLRMSASIPLMFTPVQYNRSLYVDGGVLCHLPVPDVDTHSTPNTRILTFNIRTNPVQTIDSFMTYIHALLECINEKQDIAKTEHRIIIPVQSSGAHFEMSSDGKERAIRYGYEKTQQMMRHLNRDVERRNRALSKCILRKRIQGPRITRPFPI